MPYTPHQRPTNKRTLCGLTENRFIGNRNSQSETPEAQLILVVENYLNEMQFRVSSWFVSSKT